MSGIYYVIPSQVFEDERLEHSETMFYGLLSGLAMQCGYCYASDVYLSGRMKVDESTIQRWCKKLEDLGYIRRETLKKGMKWERKIFITHSRLDLKNVYEPSPIRASSPCSQGLRTLTHKDIVSEGLVSEETVCYPTPVASHSEENSSVEKKNKDFLKFPQTVEKKTPEGETVVCKLNDILLKSIKGKIDWKTSEIQEAWQILVEYSGFVRDPFAFVNGTIRNLRTEKKSKHLAKQGKLCTNDQIMKYEESKEKLSVEDTKAPVSLGQLLEDAGMMPKGSIMGKEF